MSVKIRMRKTGGKNEPSFRVVATESRSPRDGKSLEVLGWYDPKRTGTNYQIKLDRVDLWLGRGAIISDTVRSLVRKARKAAAVAGA